MQVQPYLFFEGRCEEAIQFYRQALGAETEAVMRYQDSPQPCPEGMIPPGSEHKVMHAALRIGATTVMMSDGRCSGSPDFRGIALTLDAADDAEAKRLFNGLSDGGQVTMPLGRTFFAASFGMVTDRFGVPWMVIHHPA
jgi:PhnB protein